MVLADYALGLGARFPEQNPTPEYCMYFSVPSGGDPQVGAVLTTRAWGLSTGDEYLFAPVNVYTADGTLYYFATAPLSQGSDTTHSVTIGGSEQTESGTPGSGTATVGGSIGCIYNGHGGYYPMAGTTSITVTGVHVGTGTSSFGGSCDAQGNFTMNPTLNQIAANLASSLTASTAGVTATSNGQSVQITANAAGSGTNYPVSSSYTTNGTGYISASVPATLTGGTGTIATSDSGTVSVTVNGFTASVSYSSGTNGSAQQIASSLTSALNAGSPVQASVNGAVITLTATDPGSDSNYSLTTSVVWDTAHFTSPSFTATPSGSTLIGGTDGTLGSSPLVTQYAYDILNNLICAVQKGADTTAFSTCAVAPATWRPRSFVYDSLSRLTSATNPESGTITYTYDLNSNLATRATPKAGQTGTLQTTHIYTYDVLNRLLTETHAYGVTGSADEYVYDGTTLNTGCGQNPPTITATYTIGRRSAMCGQKSGSSWSYDPMGRTLLESTRNMGSAQKVLAVNYTYNKDGSLWKLTYPSGDVVTYTVGGAGRVTQVTDSTINFATSATYAPPGMLTGMTNGAGIVTSNIYNDRLQPILLKAGLTGQNAFFSLCYDFHLHVAINNSPCSFSAYTSGNNGNVFQVVNKVDPTRSAVYAYDPLNRVSQANTANTTSTNCWGEAYTVDSWGNLTNIAAAPGMAGNCVKEGLTATPTTQNQLNGIGLQYDAAGSVTTDNLGNTPTYDQENRIATVAGFTYYYDADGTRMEKSTGTSGTMYWPGPSGTLTETDLTGSINEEYIYFNGQRIARVDRPSGTVHYYFSNHLGSHSMVTSATGVCEQDIDYYPYGGVIADHCATVAQHYKFTGKERDSESGLDEFGARYYGSSLGRFMTPDWSDEPDPVPHANIQNPQSLNLYGYVQNNPLSQRDADGHVTCDDKWDPKTNTLIGGPCHLDPIDYLKITGYLYWDELKREVKSTAKSFSDLDKVLVPALGLDCGCDDKNGKKKTDQESSSGKKTTDPPKATSPNQMQKQVEAGQAPNSVDRVDSPRFPYEKPHIEFNDGNALNNDGTWKHGGRELTNTEKDWVTNNGWALPK
jgi:RHS repeat-associated protein